MNTAAYLRNRSPTKVLDNCTRYEIWYNRKPNVQHLKIFGSLAIALDKTHHYKFRPKGRVVGYSETSKAYRLYERGTGKIINRNFYFIEIKMRNKPTAQAELNKEIITIQMEPLGKNIVQEEIHDQSDSEFESAEEESVIPML